MDFSNRIVLLTGAASDLGVTTALLLASRGASLALADRSAETLRSIGQRCMQVKGKEPLLIVADLATDEGVQSTAKKTLEHYKRLDVLINNAGVGAQNGSEHVDAHAHMDTFYSVLSPDVRGVYNLMRLLLPALKESKGNIVNVSIDGSTVVDGCLPYAMDKAARDHYRMLQLSALELRFEGVRVDTVNPRLTVRKFVQCLTGYSDEQYVAWAQEYENNNPLQRVCYREHVAKMIAFMSSEESR